MKEHLISVAVIMFDKYVLYNHCMFTDFIY